MAKASKKSPEEKLRMVLSVLRGELSAAVAGRRRVCPSRRCITGRRRSWRVAGTCGCRELCRIWSGGISVLVDESTTAGRFHDLEVSVWLVWWVGGDGWSLVE